MDVLRLKWGMTFTQMCSSIAERPTSGEGREGCSERLLTYFSGDFVLNLPVGVSVSGLQSGHEKHFAIPASEASPGGAGEGGVGRGSLSLE